MQNTVTMSLDMLVAIAIVITLLMAAALLTAWIERRDRIDLERAHRALQKSSDFEYQELRRTRSQLAAARGELFAIHQIDAKLSVDQPTLFDEHVASAIEQSRNDHPAGKGLRLIEGGQN